MGGNRGAARRHRARSIAVVAVLFLLVSLLGATAAFAAVGFEVDIDVDDTIVAAPGTIHQVDDEDDIPAEAIGQQCTVRSVGLNQDSVHPDNDLIVESAGTTVILPDVERTAGQITEGIGTLTLGNIIVVSVRLGSDGVFSADHRLEVRCLGDPVTGRIVVVKQVTAGSDTTQAFQFAASYDADGFALSHGQQNDSGDLDPGTYSVSETVPGGWTLQSATCSDGSAPGSIALAAGETVTCTFTNVESEVDASVIVTVTPGCVITGAGPSGQVSVTMSVAGGAEVVVSDSSSQVVGSLTQDGTIDVAPGGTYTWEATPAAGFVFPPGFVASGSVTVDDCAEVGASILVTVGSTCTVSGTAGIGRVNVTMSVAGGANVVVRDSGGDIVGNLSADGSIEVPEGDVYTWVATANPGFEFPAGFASTGSVTVETCSNPDVLPFTGVDSDALAALGIVLLFAGGLTLLTGRTGPAQRP